MARNNQSGERSLQHQHEVSRVESMFARSVADHHSYRDPFEMPVEYSPSDKKILDLELAKARRMLKPHLLLVQVLSSQFQAIKYRESGIMVSLTRLMMRSLAAAKHMR